MTAGPQYISAHEPHLRARRGQGHADSRTSECLARYGSEVLERRRGRRGGWQLERSWVRCVEDARVEARQEARSGCQAGGGPQHANKLSKARGAPGQIGEQSKDKKHKRRKSSSWRWWEQETSAPPPPPPPSGSRGPSAVLLQDTLSRTGENRTWIHDQRARLQKWSGPTGFSVVGGGRRGGPCRLLERIDWLSPLCARCSRIASHHPGRPRLHRSTQRTI